jgi:hypothetical protein
MAENILNCPICGSELFINERAVYYSNPECNYVGNLTPMNRPYKRYYHPILLPLVFLILVIGLILIFISMIFFTATMFFIFISFILPIPILRKLLKRKRNYLKA